MTAGIGPQHNRAAAGTDPRGWLVFDFLPDDLQRAEDSRADADRAVMKPRGFSRPATLAERILLAHLGYSPLPADLTTVVDTPPSALAPTGRNPIMTEPIEPTPGDHDARQSSFLIDEAADPTPAGEAHIQSSSSDSLDLPQNLDQARKLRSENRALRERVHAAETNLESAVTRLAAAEHAEVLRIAAEHLIDPTDIWSAQPDMRAFYDDEFGQITADKVVATAKELAAAKPHLARPAKSPPPTDRPIEGLRTGAAPEVKPKTPSWSSAIRGTGG